MDFWAEQIKNKEQLRDSGGIDLGALCDAIEREQSKTFKILKLFGKSVLFVAFKLHPQNIHCVGIA